MAPGRSGLRGWPGSHLSPLSQRSGQGRKGRATAAGRLRIGGRSGFVRTIKVPRHSLGGGEGGGEGGAQRKPMVVFGVRLQRRVRGAGVSVRRVDPKPARLGLAQPVAISGQVRLVRPVRADTAAGSGAVGKGPYPGSYSGAPRAIRSPVPDRSRWAPGGKRLAAIRAPLGYRPGAAVPRAFRRQRMSASTARGAPVGLIRPPLPASAGNGYPLPGCETRRGYGRGR